MSYLQNRTGIQNEVKQIKKIKEVPADYIQYFREKSKQNQAAGSPLKQISVNSYDFDSARVTNRSTAYNKEEEEERYEKKKKALLVSRMLKEEESKKIKLQKENFAETVQTMYSKNKKTKKDINDDIRALLKSRNF